MKLTQRCVSNLFLQSESPSRKRRRISANAHIDIPHVVGSTSSSNWMSNNHAGAYEQYVAPGGSGEQRNLRSRSRNGTQPVVAHYHQPTAPMRRYPNSGSIAGNAGFNGGMNSNSSTDRYNPQRCRRSPVAASMSVRQSRRGYARTSSPLISPNQPQAASCQQLNSGFTSLLGSSPLSPAYLLDMGQVAQAFAAAPPQPSPPSHPQSPSAVPNHSTNGANNNNVNAIFSQMLNAANAPADSQNGSHQYHSGQFSPPPTISASAVCMWCFQQLRLATSSQVCIVTVSRIREIRQYSVNVYFLTRQLPLDQVPRIPHCTTHPRLLASTQ